MSLFIIKIGFHNTLALSFILYFNCFPFLYFYCCAGEIVVEGLKQGVNKKLAECNPLKISRQGLVRRFNQLIEKSCDQDNQASEIYEKTWRHLKTLPRFYGWKNTKPID